MRRTMCRQKYRIIAKIIQNNEKCSQQRATKIKHNFNESNVKSILEFKEKN